MRPSGGSRACRGWVVLSLASALAGPGCARPNVHPTDGTGTNPARTGPGPGGGATTGWSPDAFSLTLPDGGLPDGLEAPAAAQTITVFAHSSDRLFRVDPDSLNVVEVGRFYLRGTTPRMPIDGMTDIAVDRDGHIIGLTTGDLLQIDALDAGCVVITSLPQGRAFNGMSWVRGGGTASDEQLVATGYDGSVFRIDPRSGASTMLGALGGDLRSSGDLVSVAVHGTLATVTGNGTDVLARVDPDTGRAVTIGPIGFLRVWGLGFWQNRVFGFTDHGQFISVDPVTGKGTLVRTLSNLHFWGAGVTTSAPVIQ
jgi:hypothetical protein